jgi:anti-anti-sigma factor
VFEVSSRHEPGRFVVALVGELDIATVPVVHGVIGKRGPGENLTLDLTGLTFLDTSAISLVVEAQRSAQEYGFTLSVLRAPPRVHRVFEIAGLDDEMADRRHRTKLPRGPEAPAAARRAVVSWLAEALGAEALDDVELLVSELVTNAVRHPRAADGRIEVEAVVLPGRVRVAVSDPGTGFTKPKVGAPPPDAVGGRGLLIVDRVASSWGVTPGRPTQVWFEIES